MKKQNLHTNRDIIKSVKIIFNSYTTKNKLKEHEEICNNHNSCRIQMPKCFEKILKYNPGEKSLKAPFAIYLDLECLLKDQTHQNNNLEESYTE